MYKYSLFLVAFLLSYNVSFSQEHIKGRVLNQYGSPISEASIKVFNCTDTIQIISSGISNDTGFFSIVLPKTHSECLLISLNHLGYKPLSFQEVNKGKTNYFILEDTTIELNELIVTSDRPMVKIDQGALVYSGESLQKMGKTVANAFDVLRKLPGVITENNNISLIGMPSTTLVINGRKTLMSYSQIVSRLKTISPEMLERIDIRYDASPELGSSHSSINIITKDIPLGNHFQTDLSLGGDFAKRLTPYGNITINKSFNHILFQANYSYVNENYLTKQLLTGKNENSTIFSESSETEGGGHYHKGYISLAYPLSSDGSKQLGFNYNFDISKTNNTIDGLTFLNELNMPINSQIKNTTKTINHVIDCSYVSPRLSFTIQGLSYNIDKKSNPLITENLLPQFINQHVYRSGLTLDYNQPIKKVKGLVLLAGQYFRTSFVENKIQQKDKSVSDIKSEDREIHSETYLGVNYTPANWITIKGNVVNEWHLDEWKRTETEQRKTNRIYPTASLTFRLPKQNVLMFSYSSEFKEPSYWQLTPAVSYISELTRVEGNPRLVPSNMSSFRSTWINKGKYITQFFIQNTNNHITQQLYIDKTKMTATYYSINMTSNQQLGLLSVIPIKLSNNFDLRLTSTLFYLMHRGTLHEIQFDRKKLTGRFAFSMNYSPLNNLTCYLDGYYVTPMIQGIYDVGAMNSLDFGLRWFIKKNISLSLELRDILNGKRSSTRAKIGDQNYHFDLDNDTRVLKLGFRWTFGDTFKKVSIKTDKDRIGI